jgi:glycosyltransferase involved in cell wall biosynthesis
VAVQYLLRLKSVKSEPLRLIRLQPQPLLHFMEPYFTVIVPTIHSDLAQLSACLSALRQQTLSHSEFELVVVDDTNHAETAALVAEFARQSSIETRYLAQPQPTGLAAARNRGWRAARGRYLAFTDDNCQPLPTWLMVAKTMFQRGGQVITGTVRTQSETVLKQVSRGSSYRASGQTDETSDFVAANFFIHKAAMQRAGGFEESFDRTWRVDADLQFKLLEIGVPILKCPEAVVTRTYRPANWYTTLTNERQHGYDALLYKRHPNLYRQRVQRDEKLTLRHYLTVVSVLLALVAAALGNWLLAGTSLLTHVGLTTWLATERWPAEPTSWPDTKAALLTALATPFLSVYWRIYGAVKYRVLYW